jgi:hypothetical protein
MPEGGHLEIFRQTETVLEAEGFTEVARRVAVVGLVATVGALTWLDEAIGGVQENRLFEERRELFLKAALCPTLEGVSRMAEGEERAAGKEFDQKPGVLIVCTFAAEGHVGAGDGRARKEDVGLEGTSDDFSDFDGPQSAEDGTDGGSERGQKRVPLDGNRQGNIAVVGHSITAIRGVGDLSYRAEGGRGSHGAGAS